MKLSELLDINALVFGVSDPKISVEKPIKTPFEFSERLYNQFIYTGCMSEITVSYTDINDKLNTLVYTLSFKDYINLFDLFNQLSDIDKTAPVVVNSIRNLDYSNNGVLLTRYYLIQYDFTRILKF